MKIYIIGALKNSKVPELGNELRSHGFDVFDEWHCPGPKADEYWQEYERNRGRSYLEAINGHHARNVHDYDKRFLDAADIGILLMPAGRSGHIEFGRMTKTQSAYVLFDSEPDRYDIMYRYAYDSGAGIYMNKDALVAALIERRRLCRDG